MKRLVVQIDRMVLRGFRPEDRHAIAMGLQKELSHMLTDPRVARHLTALGNVPRLEVSGVRIEQGAKPERVGEHVALGIGAEIGK